MTITLDALVVLAGCAVLVAFWLTHLKSGIRGLLLTCTGCALIFLAYEGIGRLLSLAGIIVACVVLALVLLSVAMLARVRRRYIPRYEAPKEIDGTCSSCTRATRLKYYRQGWLCARCARRAGAKAA